MDTIASPLARKLKLKSGARAAILGAPAGYLARLGAPPDVDVKSTLDGPLDWVQVFAMTSADLAAIVGPLTGEARQTFR